MLRRIAPLLVMLLLAACASPQPSLYAPLASSDGYAEEELGKGLYRVKFQGNRVTSKERTEDYALYRAAELTLQMGRERFAVHDRLTERYTKVTRDNFGPYPYGYYGAGPYWGRGYYSSFYATSGFRYERTTYLAELTVEPFSGAAPEGSLKVYEAQEVIDRLAPQIVRPGHSEDVERAAY